MAGWDQPKVINNSKAPRLEEFTQLLTLPPNDYVRMRLHGPLFSLVYYWFDIVTKDGKKVSVPRLCLDYDPIREEFTSDICPYRASGQGRMNQVFFSNGLIRQLQKNEPRKKGKPSKFESKPRELVPGSGEKYLIKEFNSNTWTPNRLVRIPSSVMGRLEKFRLANKHKTSKGSQAFPVSHPKYGRDIEMLYDPEAQGTAKYDVQKAKARPLTEEEKGYLMQPFFCKATDSSSVRDANRDMEQLLKVLAKKKSDEDASDEDTGSSRRRRKDRDDSGKRRERDGDSRRSAGKRRDRGERKRDRDENRKKDKKGGTGKSGKSDKKAGRRISWEDDEIPF